MSQVTDLLEDLEFIRWVRYPDNELSTFWNSWMEANPDRLVDVKLAREIILGLQFPSREPSSEMKKEVLTRILRESKIFSVEQYSKPKLPEKHWWSSTWQFSRVAAILTGIVLLSLLLLKLNNEAEPEEILKKIAWISKTTNAGEKLNFRLPDQTIVWLNSGSSLVYPETFDSTVRLVKLKGEGFFDVKKEGRPFIVEVSEAKVEVLGTSFNVNSIVEGKLEVALVSGKVKVNDKLGNQVMLDPMEMIVLEDNGKIYKQDFDVRSVTGWKDKYLVFTDDDFDTVVRKIETWYGVEISTASKFNSRWAYTGQYYDESLENVLEGIAQTSKIKYKIKGKEVEITN